MLVDIAFLCGTMSKDWKPPWRFELGILSRVDGILIYVIAAFHCV